LAAAYLFGAVVSQQEKRISQRTNAPSKSPKQYIGYGVLLLAGAIGAWFCIGHAEQAGGTITLPAILLPVYKVLGKLGIVGVLVIAGAGSLGLGLKRLNSAPAEAASVESSNAAS
jgi:hypothetical protein